MHKKYAIAAVWLAVLLPLGLWGQQFTRELQLQDKRMNGPDVKLLQEKLLSLGFSEVGEADGWFGRKTKYAVEKCQMFFGFAPDGVVRKDFFTALHKTDKLTLELIDMIKRANAIDEKLEHLDSISFEDTEPDARSHGLPCYWNIYSCGGFNTPTLCVVTKGIKADCNHLMRTTYPDALRRGC